MKPYVITIARQYGSSGPHGRQDAGAQIWAFRSVSRDHHYGEVEDSGKRHAVLGRASQGRFPEARLRAQYHGNAPPMPNDSSKSYLKDEALFAYRVKIIRRLADQGPCVMIGRCADYILQADRMLCACSSMRTRLFCLRAGHEGGLAAGAGGRGRRSRRSTITAPATTSTTPATTGMTRGIMICRSTAACSGFDGTVEEIIEYMEVREQFSQK